MRDEDRGGAPDEDRTHPPSRGAAPVADQAPRCWRCDRKLAESLTRPWSITCSRCKAKNKAPV